jgi:hypothetical protein
MATAYFGLKLSVRPGVVTEGLSDDNRDKLFGKARIATRRAGRPTGPLAREVPTREPTVEKPGIKERLKHMSEGYRAIEAAIDARLDKLVSQSEGLTFFFDRSERPDLTEAISKIFKGPANKITYKMYLAALKLDKEISLQLGETLASAL